MSPAFGHGDLRLYLLKFLDESDKHGYELIGALSDHFGGNYSPSAGTIYPRLSKLEEEGLVTKSSEGRKSVYSITEAGRAELASRQGELDAIEAKVTDSIRRIGDEVRSGVDVAMKELRAELAAAATKAAAEPRASAASAVPDAAAEARSRTRAQLRDAETLLVEFRHEIRTELRTRAAKNAIPDGTVEVLRQELERTKQAVLARLKS